MGKRNDLSAEQRRDIVLQMIRKEKPVSVLSREYEVSDATLYKWQEQFLQAGVAGLKPGHTGQSAEQAEIARLKAEVQELTICIGEYTIANKILKKRIDTYRPI